MVLFLDEKEAPKTREICDQASNLLAAIETGSNNEG
jgi:hypothetical protein